MRRSEVRVCEDCGRPLRISSFGLTKGYRRKSCIKCVNIKSRYGISGADFFRMLEDQMHRCLICEEPINDLTARIDHDHSDGQVRSLLCNGCNSGIAHLKHNKEITARAVEYLTKFT